MKLTKVRVELFENVVDSTEVEIEPDVTCLVGKNESGKTAFLRAMYRLNPAYEQDSKFLPRDDYPRWRWRRDEREKRVETTKPVLATFALSADDIALVEEAFGSGTLSSQELRAWRTYANEFFCEVDVDEAAVIRQLAQELPSDNALHSAAAECKTLAALHALTSKPTTPDGTEIPEKTAKELAQLEQKLKGLREEGPLSHVVASKLLQRLPKFFYFGEYSYLPGRVALGRLLAAKKDQLSPGDRTALSLLELAGGTKESLTDEDYEQRVAELEASGNEITRQVLEYWKTNPDIRVDFDIDKKIEKNSQNQPQLIERYLDIRLHDQRHQFTTNFETRSTGFRWLFSFIAAFSGYEERPEGIVVLLDEPALNLHARAQSDFLRFINERLAGSHQVIYTTHSPFMIEPEKLRRVRLVEDKPEEGAKISSDVLSTDRDTLFPLQGALGYDLSQNLFVGAANLVIEGTSDLIYISELSRHLERLRRSHLDLARLTLTPVGGASGVPTFVALLGTHLDVTVLVDADSKVNQRLTDMVAKGLLESQRLITVGQVLGKSRADIEDLFSVSEYLSLYNEAFSVTLTPNDLPGDGRVVKRIEQKSGAFDHGRPAEVLLRNPEPFLNSLGEDTLKHFEDLFERVNRTLPA